MESGDGFPSRHQRVAANANGDSDSTGPQTVPGCGDSVHPSAGGEVTDPEFSQIVQPHQGEAAGGEQRNWPTYPKTNAGVGAAAAANYAGVPKPLLSAGSELCTR
jgi:hypothetical protein